VEAFDNNDYNVTISYTLRPSWHLTVFFWITELDCVMFRKPWSFAYA